MGQQVITDSSSTDPEPAVVEWRDLSSFGRKAVANETHDANLQQRLKNSIEDATRPTEDTYDLPRAKRRAEAKQHDSAPALATCPILNVPALFFDGDDYMFIDSQPQDEF